MTPMNLVGFFLFRAGGDESLVPPFDAASVGDTESGRGREFTV